MNNWQSASLGDLCSLITDGKHGDCQNEEGSGYYFISAKDIRNGKICYDNARQITQSDFAETHRRTDLKTGNVLLTNSGTIGRLAIARNEDLTARTTFQKSVAVLKPRQEKILSRYLYYSLILNNNALIHSANGAAQKNLLLSDLRRFVISVPPISLQSKLSKILSNYDDLIENNRRRIELLEESARSLYREWFVYLRFPSHEHTPIIDGIPEGWEEKKLCEVGYLNYGKALKEDARIPGRYPVFGSSGVIGTHNQFLIEAPGIIIGRKGSIGSVFWSSENYYPIDTSYFINSKFSNLYLYYALLNKKFMSTDAAVPGLNRDFAHSLKILIPNRKYFDLFNDFVQPVYNQISQLKKYNNKLQQARDLLLPRLMNGEIAV